MMDALLTSGGKAIVDVLSESGFEAYFVGGCVRDTWLSRPVKDIDIATSALPETVIRLFPRTFATGLQHGTVTVLMDGVPYEVTTFRTESGYSDYRRPQQVQFVASLHDDLRRRDFTMNAMALGKDGALVDPFGGRADLADGVLRCVGQPQERFSEDALRMLRAVRFAGDYALDIEPASWHALRQQAPLLEHIAMERVRSELDRMIAGGNPALCLRLLGESGLLRHTKRPLTETFARFPLERLLADADLRSLSDIAGDDEVTVRWAFIWLQWGASEEEARDTMRLLTFSRARNERICRVLRFYHKLQFNSTDDLQQWERRFKEWAVRIGKEYAGLWLCLPHAADLREAGKQWLDDIDAAFGDGLAIDGHVVADHLKHAPGPWLGPLLDKLAVEVALGNVRNEIANLLEHAALLYKNGRSDH